jgi:hypothetical protein
MSEASRALAIAQREALRIDVRLGVSWRSGGISLEYRGALGVLYARRSPLASFDQAAATVRALATMLLFEEELRAGATMRDAWVMSFVRCGVPLPEPGARWHWAFGDCSMFEDETLAQFDARTRLAA